MLTATADYALTAPIPLHHNVRWPQTGDTHLTMGRDQNLRQTDGIFLIPVPWSCAQTGTTIQVEAVGYFQTVDTLAFNNQELCESLRL